MIKMIKLMMVPAIVTPIGVWLRCAFAKLRAEQGRNPFIVLFPGQQTLAPLRSFVSLRETKIFKTS